MRTTQSIYVVYQSGEEELYDLQADPYELQNLAARPEYRQLSHTQRARLRQVCNPPPPRLTLLGYCTRKGTSKRNVIVGSRWFDYVCAKDGNDKVEPRGNADVVVAGDGNDLVLVRGGGRDRVQCGRGRDRVVADRTDVVDHACEVVETYG